jgi:hypothetical protein
VRVALPLRHDRHVQGRDVEPPEPCVQHLLVHVLRWARAGGVGGHAVALALLPHL